MSGKKLLVASLLFLALISPHSIRAAGVTIITHGFDSNATNDWIVAMAGEIPPYFQRRYPGFATNFTIYTVILTTDGDGDYFYQWQRIGNAPSNNAPGEIIVQLDWSQMAGSPTDVFDPFNDDTSTKIVAGIANSVISQTNAIADLNGHALAEFPIHLIGHSRGGSLMNELSRVLGTNGIWTDHLTTLDPHPLNNDGNNDPGFFPTDATANITYNTILFRDNYWQDLGTGVDFDGEPASGAYNRQLTDLDGGYNDSVEGAIGIDAPYHSNVHLWYWGTIDSNTPASYNLSGDTAAINASNRANWWVPYEDDGLIAGFYYSLIGDGNRLSTDSPLGLPSDPAIVNGYNQWWNLGAGSSTNNRTALTANSGAWPNLIQFNLTGTNVVTKNQTIPAAFYYQYGGHASNVTVQFYFDGDLNPYGTNGIFAMQLSLPNTGVNSVYLDSINLATTNIPSGTYAVYGKISDGTHARYLYTPQLVQIISPPPLLLGVPKITGNQFIIAITGIPGQKIVLQSSANLQSWQPLATNTLTAGGWLYTNTVSLGSSRGFYRAILTQ